MHTKKEIQLLMRQTHQRNQDTLMAVDAAEGEHIGKTWSSRNKTSKPRDMIKGLRDPINNEYTRDLKKITQIAAEYHKKLQHEGHNPMAPLNEPKSSEILNLIRARLSAESKEFLNENLLEDQVREAIKKTATDKAPGPDDIPINLWKSMDDQFWEERNKGNTKKKCNIVWALT